MFDKTEKLTLSIEGMSCMHCVKSVTDTLKALKGVKKADVNLEAGSAEIVFVPSKISREEMISAVNSAGFKAE